MSAFSLNNDFFLLYCQGQPWLIPTTDVRYIVRSDEVLLVEGIAAVYFDRTYFPVYHLGADFQLYLGRQATDASCLVLASGDRPGAALACESLVRLSFFEPPRPVPETLLTRHSPLQAMLAHEERWYGVTRAERLLSLMEYEIKEKGHGQYNRCLAG